ncbi:RNA-binding protein [Vibrio aestuarianus]|uniref:RNA recognition motif domain-containing protein n=1 Tax=Vibrio aestuarianus TaxID=28171 RepID=UPI0021C46C00|nr:RNA-binding protein [Vibrio aestuarianus]MDE1211373.1 RNA-binding protein [Vibrio aestuarianus]MDE1225548.1 RNA-binding protein [Vibrio aestuarianus]MDE1318992.1 RNA-binding protein [Vibrio aestuarianus]CAH8228924.1 RNA-binding protein [Vibrio aestuarianus]
MNSNKSTLLIASLAIIGAIVFSLVALSPAITFVLGVVSSAFVFKFCGNSTVTDEDPKLSTKTLYVGNLPYKANEAHVRELFAKEGEVFAVRLMKDKRTGKRRGFGFVVMASSDVDSAIAALNEKDYMQRTLKVRVANDPKHPDSEMFEQD